MEELFGEPGVLVLIDEPSGTWGVVEGVEPDPLEDGMVCVTWRDSVTGESCVVSVPSGEAVTIRRAHRSW